MTVTGHEDHHGTDAWNISLKPDRGRPVWTLWVSAADGRPLELADPSDGGQVVRWTTYEVLRDADADAVLTLAGAHPDAHVSDDPDAAHAAEERIFPAKGR
jgi:hypothetical protein